MGTEFSYVIFLLRTVLWLLKNRITDSSEDCLFVGGMCVLCSEAADLPVYAFFPSVQRVSLEKTVTVFEV